jgi:(1->4)-alpha-D-glucan 1-alpha-D-glucosylmutase
MPGAPRRPLTGGVVLPVRATYRLQLGGDVDLDTAAELVDYLDALGISHLYTSPFLAARSGSPHGYDIIDHNSINPELGGRDAFERLHARLAARAMGCILDFVPNHMGIGRADNPWWLDVLEWGRSSAYADYFDIDWEPAKRELRGKVLLPFLGAPYGEELEAGALRLEADLASGSLWVQYHEHRFPIGPRHCEQVLGPAVARLPDGPARGALAALRAAFHALPRGEVPRSRRVAVRAQADALRRRLADLVVEYPEAGAAVDDEIVSINGEPGQPRSFVALHRLLEAQAYRLSYWRVAADEINYRRFFDINELAGLRVERPELFDAMHRLVFRLVDEGKLDGLRIDHIDGLYDPRQYCERLASRFAGPGGERRAYLVVEKILAPHERLPDSWPVDGTTGYEFANQILGLFIDPAGERRMDSVYRWFTGEEESSAEVLRTSKAYVLHHLLASELQVLANELDRIAERSWRTRDLTLNTLREALAETMSCFPVYRTYIAAGAASAEDLAHIGRAVDRARRRRAVPTAALEFVKAVLTAEFGRRTRRRGLRRRVVDFAAKAQQLTSPVAAKGEEDTAFYRYTRFVALNEVGGDPDNFGTSMAAFHRRNEERVRVWPRSMLATSTHDTKRGEDVRARLAVLSEKSEEWRRCVARWARLNRRARTQLDDGLAPTRNDEYLLYQTLLGSWPLELADEKAIGEADLSRYRDRIAAYMIKSAREAKLRSSWAEPNERYEQALEAFVDHLLDPHRNQRFLADFLTFQRRIAVLGMINGLSQTLLRLTTPGVPDTYQGCELWDLSLVDPDNRRPVDFAHRSHLLRGLKEGFADPSASSNAAGARALFEAWPDGRIKLYLIWRLLELRRARPDLFDGAAYLPLSSSGLRAEHTCVFARVPGNRDRPVVIVTPRLIARLWDAADGGAVGHRAWGDTVLICPDSFAGRRACNILTGTMIDVPKAPDGAFLAAADVFEHLPVAALVVE